MYVPRDFAETDREALDALMRRYDFATLVTTIEGAPVATHLPLLLDSERGAHGTLLGHMARTNPQWREFAPVAGIRWNARAIARPPDQVAANEAACYSEKAMTLEQQDLRR